jgi:hypothetical protein
VQGTRGQHRHKGAGPHRVSIAQNDTYERPCIPTKLSSFAQPKPSANPSTPRVTHSTQTQQRVTHGHPSHTPAVQRAQQTRGRQGRLAPTDSRIQDEPKQQQGQCRAEAGLMLRDGKGTRPQPSQTDHPLHRSLHQTVLLTHFCHSCRAYCHVSRLLLPWWPAAAVPGMPSPF